MIRLLALLVIVCAILLLVYAIRSISSDRKAYDRGMEMEIPTKSPSQHGDDIWRGAGISGIQRIPLREFPKIQFDKFRTFYELNPDAWCLDTHSVYRNDDEYKRFVFSYEDWKRYRKFVDAVDEDRLFDKRTKYEREIDSWSDGIAISLLEEVQKDIEAVKKKASNEMGEARDIHTRVRNSMGE